MAWTIQEALKNSSVTLQSQSTNEFQFKVGVLNPTVTVRLTKDNSERGGFNFEQSHYIKTPEQAGAYRTSRPWGDYEGYALHLALTSITQHYDEAVKLGHSPDDSWLVGNDKF